MATFIFFGFLSVFVWMSIFSLIDAGLIRFRTRVPFLLQQKDLLNGTEYRRFYRRSDIHAYRKEFPNR